MKIAVLFTLLLFAGISLQAQVKNVEKEAEKQGTKRINTKIDKGIDSGFDAIEDGIGSLFGKKKKKKKKKDQSVQENTNDKTEEQINVSESNQATTEQAPQIDVQWAKFDFVPGDEVIFEDGPSTDEENGEFPSRWDLHDGSAEIGAMNGEPIIMFLNGGGAIVPYLKNSKEAYLPEIFTIEFDVWFSKGKTTNNRYFISFRDLKNQWNKGLGERLVITPTGLEFGNTDKRYPGTESLGWSSEPTGKWRHISIAYTKGKFKAYMGDTRLINVPHLDGKPWGLTISALAENMYLRNVRIAKGGVKYYDRVLSDGKIIVNGIRFDVNKATIKPESNGAINEIFQLMQKQTDLNFSVEGHTDSDGDDALNQTLSEQRAKAVKDRLISMGISSSRLKSAGWGESKPIGENGTPEGKANNRRVEFVKFEGSATPSVGSSSSAGNPAFDKLDKESTKANLYKLFEAEHYSSIPISNNTGIVNGPGTVMVYATSDGYYGKMEILDVDKTDNFKLTIKYVTYNDDGSVHCQSNHFEIKGTYTCDLDKENAKDMIHSEIDFHFAKENVTNTSLSPGELSSFRIVR